jgi:hypothetical protein
MARVAFADESGTTDRLPCYAIGVVSVDEDALNAFNQRFESLRRQHGFEGEAKWTRVRKGHGLVNFALDWLHKILNSRTVCFDAIVVHKELFNKWEGSSRKKEEAFYLTYTYLLRHIARRANETTNVFIDDRADTYAKRHEVVETIGNHMLVQLESKGRLDSVTKVKSHDYPGIQIADLLTGAITTAHVRHLDRAHSLNPGKRLAIDRMAWLLSWDDLCYDTYPHPRFNIWHFPIEYRATPGSMLPQPRGPVPFVTPENMDW